MKTDNISFCSRAQNICKTCTKIVNPLLGVKVVKLDKYREEVGLDSDYNKARVVLDLDMKYHRVLYYMLTKILKEQPNESI